MGKGNKFKQEGEVDAVGEVLETDPPEGYEAPATETAKERLFDILTTPGGPPPLAEKYRGEKCYQLSQPHYRDGRMFAAGECVRVKDEKPGKSWRPIVFDERYEMISRIPLEVDALTGKPAAPEPVFLGEPVGRASDREV